MRKSYIAEEIMAEYHQKQKWKKYYENQKKNKEKQGGINENSNK